MPLRTTTFALTLLLPVAMNGSGTTDDARSHWAFQPVTRPAEPPVQHPTWIKTPVDSFILAKLEGKGMKPSVAAGKETLLRRVTFDLTGLPPTTDELRDFLADASPDAFATVVDRLLRSPHFGECWGRHWLDTARYSDTAGQVTRNMKVEYRYSYAWSYRDYVIDAFNFDKPYNQLILEQIAADKLPLGDDKSALAALGFLTVGERFANNNDVINDRIDAVTKGFLGLTVACARCHDHKFDPIPTEDYYSLHGIFNSSIEPVERPLIATAKDKALTADYMAKLHALEEQNRGLYYDAVEKINGEFRRRAAELLMLQATRPRRGVALGTRTMQPAGTDNPQPARTRSMQPAGTDNPPTARSRRPQPTGTDNPPPPSTTRTMRPTEPGVTPPSTPGTDTPPPTRPRRPQPAGTDNPPSTPTRTIQSAEAGGALPPSTPGTDTPPPARPRRLQPAGTDNPPTTPVPAMIRGMQPNAAGNTPAPNPRGMQAAGTNDERLADMVLQNANMDDPVWGPWLRFRQMSPDEIASDGATYAADVAAHAATATTPGWNALIAAQFKNAAPKSLSDVAALYGAAFTYADGQAAKYLAAKRVSTTSQVAGFHPAVAELIEKPLPILAGESLNTEHLRDAVAKWPRALMPGTSFVFDPINELDISHPGAPAHAMVMEDSSAPVDSAVLVRGQAQVRGPVVPRRFLEILSGPKRPVFKEGSGQLELAQAIASKSNPLTARVLVNRVWMHLFGEGFVPTPDDMGVQSEKPVYPELLDWLASYFMDQGWSQKKLIRMIVLSNTYQQSSDENPEYTKLDSNNRLLWHANLRRLDFEATRDSLLVFSGKLDPTLGGKSVNLTEEPYSFRRSVYGYVDRGNLPVLMQQFDFPDPDMPNSKRATTVVPQQALFFMNSPMAVDVVRKMVARQEFTGAFDDPARIAALYRILFQRAPRPEEVQLGLSYVKGLKEAFPTAAPVASNPPETSRQGHAGRGVDTSRTPVKNEGERVDRSPLTPWEQYAQALLFTNEVVYVN